MKEEKPIEVTQEQLLVFKKMEFRGKLIDGIVHISMILIPCLSIAVIFWAVYK